MASVWKFASTRGLIFFADAQSADPEELQVLDTSLPTKLVIGLPVLLSLLGTPKIV